MAKVFIDIEIMPPKAWRKLDVSLKIAWYYIWTNCDRAGVWPIDMDRFEFDNGIEFDLEGFKNSFANLIEISGEKVLLKDYLKINYGTLRQDYNPHKPAFRDMAKNNVKLEPSLNQAYFKLVDVDEDEDEDKEEDLKEKEGVGEKTNPNPELPEVPPKPKIDLNKVVEIFNSVCHMLPTVSRLTDTRKTALKCRIEEVGLTGIGNVFQKVAQSKFLKGENDRGWKADFDWILKPANFIKILEGKYDNASNGTGQQKSAAEQFAETVNSEAARNFKFSP